MGPADRGASNCGATSGSKRRLVIIPAYQEADTVRSVVSAARKALPGCDVVVVDDGSLDATASEARAAGAIVLRHPANLGYGAALQTGYKYAVRMGYEVVAQMDADGQHDPSSLRPLLAPIENAEVDMALGSRTLSQVRYHLPLARRVGMRIFSALVCAATGMRVTDPTSGFQAMSAAVAKFLATDVFPSDYADADVLILLKRAGFRILEVPVVMHPAPGGRSMHRGLRPLYYVFRMLLSILVETIRRAPRPGGGKA